MKKRPDFYREAFLWDPQNLSLIALVCNEGGRKGRLHLHFMRAIASLS